jgi:GNAT superfamily N-acetyltransferase
MIGLSVRHGLELYLLTGALMAAHPNLPFQYLPEFRGYGIGTKLMNKLFESLKESGYTQTSLSVQKDNPAVQFYLRWGMKL